MSWRALAGGPAHIPVAPSRAQVSQGTPTLQGARWYYYPVGCLRGLFLHGKWTKLDISNLI